MVVFDRISHDLTDESQRSISRVSIYWPGTVAFVDELKGVSSGMAVKLKVPS
jgi:hypothetical protein